jgi:photosystem II stability/assembly factor-like uncharacterized protein
MKHSLILRAGLVLAILLVFATLAGPIRGQETVLTETFDDASLPEWEHPPEVAVVDGVLRVPAPGFAFRGGLWADLTLSARARYTGQGDLLIVYRWSDAGEYRARLGGDSVALQRVAGSATTELGAVPSTVPSGQWVQLSVTVAGGEHVVTLDDRALLTVTDPDPLPPGGIGLRVEGQATGEFDDLVLTVTGEAPPPDEATPMPEATPVTEPPVPAAGVPAYQALPWIRTGGPIGGLGYDIRYNFADYNIWYVTDAFSGFHMSTDNGLTWFLSNQGITARFGTAGDVIPIFSATVDPHNPNIVWIGTQNTGDIYKSTDGGYTWVAMNNGISQDILPLSFRGFTVDPRSSDIVYAMAEIGSPGWTPDGTERKGLELDLTQGIVYKTTDGGQNWTQIWRGDNLARYCWIDPRDPNVLYVSTGIFDREAANTDVAAGFAGGVGILKSTDGGETWRALNQENGLLDLYVGSLYMHPTNPDVLLAAASQNNWSHYGDEFTGGVFLTEDGGEHWERVLTGELFSGAEFCTSDPNVAYAASEAAVYRSGDGGHTWQRFSHPNDTWGPPGIIAGFPIDMQCDPRDTQRIFVNNYLGGNFLSEDGGRTWQNASQGYTGAMVRHVAIASGQARTAYAGSRTGVFRTDDGGGTWIGLTNPPEGLRIRMNEITGLAVDLTNVDHLLAAPADIAAAVQTYDGGQSWNHVALPGAPSTPLSLVFAPSEPTTVYAAVSPYVCMERPTPAHECNLQGTGVYLSHDGGASWAPTGGGQVKDKAVLAIAVYPQDPYAVYAATHAGEVFRTTDGGTTWTPLSAGLPALPVLDLAIDPSNPSVIFAGLAGGSVYKSTDGGLSWVSSAAGLDPNGTARSIVVDPANSQIVYVADSFSGVYVSTDGGGTWQAINEGLDHRAVNVLALSDDGTVLYAGIEGAGVYRLGTPSGAQPQASPTVQIGPVLPVGTPSEAPPIAPPEVVPLPCGAGGICPGAAALPLALLSLVLVRQRIEARKGRS